MQQPDQMHAIALDRFGGVEHLAPRTLAMPEIGPNEVLVKVATAGVGVWDPLEREGGFAAMTGTTPRFPYVLGSEGAGTVVRVGEEVEHLAEGDRVYGMSVAGPKGGFYAEYVAVDAESVARVPERLTLEQAGAMPADAVTALCGLTDVLELKEGESLMIVGASGGIGHLAVQLAKRLGARVLAVSSGADGVKLSDRLGADTSVDGHGPGVAEAARRFAPDGLDAVLLTAGGAVAREALGCLKAGGRAAYPNGVEPAPEAPEGVRLASFDGNPERRVLARLNELIEAGPFEVHVAKAYPLDRAAEAHRALGEHYLGKLALHV